MTASRNRAFASALILLVVAGCSSTASPRSARAGDWHFDGGTSSLGSRTDGGDFGDVDTISAQIAGGVFVARHLLLEGLLAADHFSFDGDGNVETKLTTASVGAGLRLYSFSEGKTRPYLGLRGGLSHLDVNDEFTGLDDSDTAPFAEARLGLESFLGDTVALDIGLYWQGIFARELRGIEDDISSVGAYVGLSIWP
jgi:hypothetical protein